uniref:Uncharacterized protein n=1 Tax=Arundo donax TaxID=35708 RepID=A0A0A9HM20_ARUDO
MDVPVGLVAEDSWKHWCYLFMK